ncbi:hypothetical protein AVEN_263116-1 [Araneus ventricosus]|uniref:Uncharacterized protein n=1 Tax=Araneus ventricosus TaxID=182803 RepID=A0A4Y2JC59_ARAVE|nr:hypothetical protein AVEN_263116-1 [Araneus ventricosus]
MMRTTPELEHPFQNPAPHQLEGIWHPTYDLACVGSIDLADLQIIVFRAWDPAALSRNLANGPSLSNNYVGIRRRDPFAHHRRSYHFCNSLHMQ